MFIYNMCSLIHTFPQRTNTISATCCVALHSPIFTWCYVSCHTSRLILIKQPQTVHCSITYCFVRDACTIITLECCISLTESFKMKSLNFIKRQEWRLYVSKMIPIHPSSTLNPPHPHHDPIHFTHHNFVRQCHRCSCLWDHTAETNLCIPHFHIQIHQKYSSGDLKIIIMNGKNNINIMMCLYLFYFNF